jgi:dihydrolipoamide dehydrogenase
MDDKDIVVIGGGAAGYKAASRASHRGAKVMVVEKGDLGGVCVHWGCIPMLFLLHQVGLVRALNLAKEHGIYAREVGVHFGGLKSGKDAFVKTTSDRMRGNLKARHIEVVRGCGRLASPHRVEIELEEGTIRTVSARKVILATGSVPKKLSVNGADGPGVMTMKEALSLSSVPKSAVIVGGGVIGSEMATLWANLGCKVTVVERMPRLIPQEDVDLSLLMEQVFKRQGIQVYLDAEVQRIEDVEARKSLTIAAEGREHILVAQVVVCAMGQRPWVEGIGLEGVGVAIHEGRIQTNDRMETTVPGVFAAGDATGEIMLANVAMAQGMVAAENAMGRHETMDYRVVPRTIRTFPEIGAIGITEQEARKNGMDIKVSQYPLKRNAKAAALKEYGGFVKMIAHGESGEILGLHIFGPQATELIHEGVMIMQMGATVWDVAKALHGHPCLHEAINQAAMGLLD